MKAIKYIGLTIFLVGLSIFTLSIFDGSFGMTQQELNNYIDEKGYKSDIIKEELSEAIVDKELSIFEFSSKVRAAFETNNAYYDKLIAKYDAEKNILTQNYKR